MANGLKFVRLPEAGLTPTVFFTFDGVTIEAHEGDSIAVALLASGVASLRRTRVSGSRRGPYCLMGACFDCLVSVDGVAGRQACMVAVKDQMVVRSDDG